MDAITETVNGTDLEEKWNESVEFELKNCTEKLFKCISESKLHSGLDELQ